VSPKSMMVFGMVCAHVDIEPVLKLTKNLQKVAAALRTLGGGRSKASSVANRLEA
jgi:hypothetical protein